MRESRKPSTESQIPEQDRSLIDRFVARLRQLPEVHAVVLFGSFVRGDVDRRSDIDLLVVVDRADRGALRPVIARLISDMKPHREINPTLTNLSDLEPTFLRNVFREGVVLHGKIILSPEHLAVQPRVMLAYDLSALKPSEKVGLSRMIHGFESRKTVGGRRRVYRYPGLKDRYGATIVSRSVFLVRPEDAGEFTRELDARRVPYARWEVYL